MQRHEHPLAPTLQVVRYNRNGIAYEKLEIFSFNNNFLAESVAHGAKRLRF